MQPTCQLQLDSTEDGTAGTDAPLTLQHAAGLTPGTTTDQNALTKDLGTWSKRTAFVTVLLNVYQSLQPVMDVCLKLCVV